MATYRKKLTGPACAEALNKAEKAEAERAEEKVGEVQVERQVQRVHFIMPSMVC